MNINKSELYKLYMQWVEMVSEDHDWKTQFHPREIVDAIAVILESNPQLISFPKQYTGGNPDIKEI